MDGVEYKKSKGGTRMKRRILSLLLAMVMMVGMLPVGASAHEEGNIMKHTEDNAAINTQPQNSKGSHCHNAVGNKGTFFRFAAPDDRFTCGQNSRKIDIVFAILAIFVHLLASKQFLHLL